MNHIGDSGLIAMQWTYSQESDVLFLALPLPYCLVLVISVPFFMSLSYPIFSLSFLYSSLFLARRLSLAICSHRALQIEAS